MDDVVLAYVEWREECSAVRQVCARWPEASSGEATLAQAAYSAALDREEAAARTYAQLIEAVGPLLKAELDAPLLTPSAR